MATQEIGQETELARASAFLAERRIAPDAAGAYPEAAILDAIRGRGWEVRLHGTEDDWYADVGEERGRDWRDDVYLLASDRDRQTALLKALDVALLWLDRDAMREILDREARERLGIDGEEFRRRRSAGEYDEADFEPLYSDVLRLDSLAAAAH